MKDYRIVPYRYSEKVITPYKYGTVQVPVQNTEQYDTGTGQYRYRTIPFKYGEIN